MGFKIQGKTKALAAFLAIFGAYGPVLFIIIEKSDNNVKSAKL